VVTGDHYDRRIGQGLTKALKLQEGVYYRLVRGANGVENVACNHHQLRIERDYPIDGMLESSRNVRLTLVDTSGRLPLELPEAKVEVG